MFEAQLNESAFFGVLWLYFEVEQKDKLLADKSLGRQGKNSCNDDFSLKLYNEKKKSWPLAHESLSCPEQQTLVKSLALWQLDLSWMGRAASKASTTADCPKEAIKYSKVLQIFEEMYIIFPFFFHSDFLICSIKYR